MRSNMGLDEELIERARQLTGIKTKRGVIHAALRMLIKVYEQDHVRELRSKLRWEGDLAVMREGRNNQ
jgi:Arc/MetJ family transcription regulator